MLGDVFPYIYLRPRVVLYTPRDHPHRLTVYLDPVSWTVETTLKMPDATWYDAPTSKVRPSSRAHKGMSQLYHASITSLTDRGKPPIKEMSKLKVQGSQLEKPDGWPWPCSALESKTKPNTQRRRARQGGVNVPNEPATLQSEPVIHPWENRRAVLREAQQARAATKRTVGTAWGWTKKGVSFSSRRSALLYGAGKLQRYSRRRHLTMR